MQYIDADEERPRNSLKALWKALICKGYCYYVLILVSCFGMLGDSWVVTYVDIK